jgi:hypothetical protein
MNNRQKIALGLMVVAAAVLAYLLKDAVAAMLFEPVSYVWYALNLFYLSIAQVIFWFGVVVIAALIAFGSLYGKFGSPRLVEEDTKPKHGPVANAARHISRSSEGIYYKWLVANRFGKLARSIVASSVVQETTGNVNPQDPSCQPPLEIIAYLESGLMKTFTDYPNRAWLGRPVATPLDVDIEQVIAYLESQMER